MSSLETQKTLDASNELKITVTGRKTGQQRSTPVWFVREGKTVFLLPLKGSGTQWYRNMIKSKRIRISSGKLSFDLSPKPMTDSRKVASVVDKFRKKHGAGDVKKYYTVFDAALELTLP